MAAVLPLVILAHGSALAENTIAPSWLTASDAVGAAAARVGAQDLMVDWQVPDASTTGNEKLRGVLNLQDRRLYEALFALQHDGRWRAADQLIDQISDPVLMGHVAFQRYMHPTAYRSSFAELAGWLDKYSDLPGARRVYRLALKRKPSESPAPQKPNSGYLGGIGDNHGPSLAALAPRDLEPRRREIIRTLAREIRACVRRGTLDAAVEILRRPEFRRHATPLARSVLQAEVSHGFLAAGQPNRARHLAEGAISRDGPVAAYGHWTAGLATWRLGDIDGAARHFQAAARSGADNAWLVSGAAYWAARAAAVRGQPALASDMLEVAAGHTRTFYGMIARRALGKTTAFDWAPTLHASDPLAAVRDLDATRRAVALSEIGRHGLAAQELRRLYPQLGREHGPALLKLAELLQLPAVEIRIGSMLPAHTPVGRDQALYPVPQWTPEKGFDVDKALVLAVIRQESGFDPDAKSRRGARGLMQIMPRTASYIDDGGDYRGAQADKLFAPELNLSLGQKYVRYLLDHPEIGDNLIYLLAAYNGGPGTLGKWRATIADGGDPLMFLESIPLAETRRYVRRVLTNLWAYRDRFGQSTVSLDALAGGGWPRYSSLDNRTTMAQNGGN